MLITKPFFDNDVLFVLSFEKYVFVFEDCLWLKCKMGAVLWYNSQRFSHGNALIVGYGLDHAALQKIAL